MPDGHKTVVTAAALALALVAAACGEQAETATATPGAPVVTPDAAAAAPPGGDDAKQAPELAEIGSWINSEPLTIAGQRGKVVLVDFWTYSCVNCIRTLPYLKEWHRKYADEGLVIVGVHTPEFEFEKDRANVVAAVAEHGLEYAIAQDNDAATWDAFKNQWWPAKYLIDGEGHIRYQHFGEGAYAETEQNIRELLAELGGDVTGIAPDLSADPKFDRRAVSCYRDDRMTRELYAGYSHNESALFSPGGSYILQRGFFGHANLVTDFEDQGRHRNQYIYVQGRFKVGRESLIHARETEGYEDYLVTVFFARSVNIVMASESGDPYSVRVTIDGRPLEPTEAGADVRWDEQGNSYVTVHESRMYRVVQLPEFDDHKLKISSNSAGFSVFAYTFGAFTTADDGITADYAIDCPPEVLYADGGGLTQARGGTATPPIGLPHASRHHLQLGHLISHGRWVEACRVIQVSGPLQRLGRDRHI